MYCNHCGSDRHYAGNCDAIVDASSVNPVTIKKAPEGGICPSCGTDLDAKQKHREYMRLYMAERRRK